MGFAGMKYSDDELEKRWQDHIEKEAYFHRSPQESDNEVIQCWMNCLRHYTSSGSGSVEEGEEENS
jgi:hypothetical protein